MRHVRFWVLLLAATLGCSFSPRTDAQQPGKNVLLVADFDQGIRNHLGGYYNKFERSPSASSTFLSHDVRRGGGGRSLRVSVDRQEEGFCGVWMHLFDFRAPLRDRQYFDSRGYKYLSFWVRGEKGGERFTVKLADEKWVLQEDALPVGDVNEFLRRGVTTQWQEVRIPLERFTLLHKDRLGGVTLDFDTPGKHTVYIDDVAFKTSRRAHIPVTPKSDTTEIAKPQYPRAMWVWSTRDLLLKDQPRADLFEFCRRENINQLWLQLLYAFEPGFDLNTVPTKGLPKNVKCIVHYRDEFRRFLREAHEKGIAVHVLDGYPEYAQKEFHALPLAIVDAVIDFNNQSQPGERFDGLHFDNEPYLLIGTRDRARYKQILREFLDLNSKCQQKVREKSEMVFGVDIPFFWHDRDPRTGEIVGEVDFNGQTKAASFHCIDILDNVGIMNYRDTADGADGMIAHGMDILEYADQADKAKIYMGIETFSYQPTDVWFAVGLPRELFSKAVEKSARDFAHLSRINGYRTQIFDDGANVHVGIELPPDPSEEEKNNIRAAMVLIAKRFGASAYRDLVPKVDDLRQQLHTGVRHDVEWDNSRDRDIVNTQDKTRYAGVVAVSIMLPKITFAQETYGQITTQVGAAEEFFSRYKSYAGIAIHYYETYRAKMEQVQQ